MKVVSAEFLVAAAKIEQCPAGANPEIALAGRSNVGKSSLLNRLVNRNNLARVSNTPGRTQTINFYFINKKFFLVDLPGYGFAKVPKKIKRQWSYLVEGYLQERKQLYGMVLIVDIRHLPTRLDVQLYEWLKYYDIPAVVVATKADKVSYSQRLRQLQVIKLTLNLTDEVPLIMFSAKTGEGKDELWKVIDMWLG